MSGELPKRIEKPIRRILSYLMTHPEAKDTVEGVKQWWLSNGQNNLNAADADDVEQAIEWLVSQGWMVVRVPPPLQEIYGLNRGRITEIQEFLRMNSNKEEQPLDE